MADVPQVHADLVSPTREDADGGDAHPVAIGLCALARVGSQPQLRLRRLAAVVDAPPLRGVGGHVDLGRDLRQLGGGEAVAQDEVLPPQALRVQLQAQAVVAFEGGPAQHQARARDVEPVQEAVAPLGAPHQRAVAPGQGGLQVRRQRRVLALLDDGPVHLPVGGLVHHDHALEVGRQRRLDAAPGANPREVAGAAGAGERRRLALAPVHLRAQVAQGAVEPVEDSFRQEAQEGGRPGEREEELGEGVQDLRLGRLRPGHVADPRE
mmetsp:Transcript_82659/g.212977  ORF Transcript_82659/g.212977 Transcript_82659/m.212977 type:complete len:266 (-) Transcript_82659:4-801(-)